MTSFKVPPPEKQTRLQVGDVINVFQHDCRMTFTRKGRQLRIIGHNQEPELFLFYSAGHAPKTRQQNDVHDRVIALTHLLNLLGYETTVAVEESAARITIDTSPFLNPNFGAKPKKKSRLVKTSLV